MCALARDRKTVWASIHQPCSEVFELLDQLYSLEGGRTVYCRQASEAYEVPVYQSIHFCARHNLAYCNMSVLFFLRLCSDQSIFYTIMLLYN
ncbi:hypothetical protein HN873_061275 [Arachis hypogaea]